MATDFTYSLMLILLFTLIFALVLLGLIFLTKKTNKCKHEYMKGQRKGLYYFSLAIFLTLLISSIAGGFAGFLGLILSTVFLWPSLQPYSHGAGIALFFLAIFIGAGVAIICFGILLWQWTIKPYRLTRRRGKLNKNK